jgi:hypothetical protein
VVDDYSREIAELETQIDAKVEAEEDPKEIEELRMQLYVMRAIYEKAQRLWDEGREDPELPSLLALRGFGEWTMENVYAFVYEASVELPGEGHRAFLSEIKETDFSALLR